MRDLLDRLQRRLPIWSAGMGGGLAGAELVAAVSNGGGLGVLGTGGLRGAAVSALLERTAELTSAPFGANIILPMSNGSDIEACFNARVPVLVLFWGDPQPFVGDAHRRDMYIVAQCVLPSDAVAAADAGVDAVILQGIEAGGHVMAVRPLRDTLAETLPALGPVPVIAAGGIATGADIADALKLGAPRGLDGLALRCLRGKRAHVRYKERLVSAHEDDTVLTELFDRGWQQACHRVIRNEQVETWDVPDARHLDCERAKTTKSAVLSEATSVTP